MKITSMKLNNLTTGNDDIVVPLNNLKFEWSAESNKKNSLQTSSEIIILDETGEVIYTSGRIKSDNNQFHLHSAKLQAHTTYTWQVRITDNYRTISPWSPKMTFTTELKHWDATWIEPKQADVSEEAPLDLAAMFGGKPMPKQTPPEQRLRPVQYLRKNFKLKKAVKKVQLFMTAHGIYYPLINGQKITQAQFMPDFTSYKNILQYQYFDITKFVGTDNDWTVVLADGWYSGRISTTGNGGQFGNKNGILGEIIVTYADGTQDIIKTDQDFRSITGKYIYSDIFIGEKQDLRQTPDWNNSQKVDEVSYSLDNLIPQDAQYVHQLPAISAKKIWRDGDAILVDFGQVIAGKIKLSTYLSTGTSIKIEHSEVLNKEGHFFNNITGRNKDQTDYFIGRGNFETLTPDFTFHGFRYVKITGLMQTPSLNEIVAVPLMTEMKELGSLETSNKEINQLIKNIQWSQRGNMLSIPTDCPQRERAGWTGDAQVFAPTALFNMDVTAMLKRWLESVRAEQRVDGQIQDYAPAPKEFYTSSPQFTGTYSSAGWGDAIIMLPWTIYKNDGDKSVLKENYLAMQKWHEFAVQSAAQGKKDDSSQYIWDTKFHYGDWMFPSYMLGKDALGPMETAKATKDIVATAFLSYTSQLLAKIATVLGDEKNALDYQNYAKNVATAFQKHFWKDQKLTAEFQGCYVLAIAFNLLDKTTTEQAVEHLVTMIHKNNDCLDTGFLSVPYLLDVLCQYGHKNLAETILLQKKMPSWLYEVDHGATTIWESWGGIAPDGTVGTYSFNHYAFGCVEHWIIENIGGLSPIEPGYRKFKITIPDKSQFTSSKLSYRSTRGLIKVNWKYIDDDLKIQVHVPFNTTAQLIMKHQTKELGSGDYEFNI
ncbi:alpha-L-rhamnosidase [Companilactobacillus sp. HBUAS56275]|uniref:alpha-L-rhamnosidase n=1 Tax=Candidatus Companilactobacillus pullicola TaxID=2838523 RepID=A0A9D2CNR4_9LACO|nr:glycoside hydrolase family 78 protein [Candidatus Companilactobacillus pullicola]